MLAELREMFLNERDLSQPSVDIDAEHPGNGFCRKIQTLGVEIGRFGKAPDGRVYRVYLAVTTLEDPLQDAAVLAVSRPEELAVLIGAEPVHVENFRQLVRIGALADVQPVGKVIAHVVSAERQH